MRCAAWPIHSRQASSIKRLGKPTLGSTVWMGTIKRICWQGLTELPTNIRDNNVSSAQALARLTRQLAIAEERARVAERKARVTQSQLAVHRKNAAEKLRADLGGVGADVQSSGVVAAVASKPLSVLEKKQKRIGERTHAAIFSVDPQPLILFVTDQKGRGRMPMTYTEKGRETQIVMLRTEIHDMFSDILDKVGLKEDMDEKC